MPIKITYSRKKPYENVKRGTYFVAGKEMFFRSKMEANYALCLEFFRKKGQIVSWEYEPEVFVFEKILFGTRSYKPDFRVVLPNGRTEYHETKGFLDPKSKTKLARMKKYFPEVKIVYIGRVEYRELAKWSKLLGWY